MPEGPEVRNLSEQLNKELQNASIVKIEIGDKYTQLRELKDTLISLTILEVSCKGKLLYFSLSNEHYLTNHMAMTGHWYEKEGEHTHLSLTYQKDEKEKTIYYDDVRGFGKFEYLNRGQLEEKLAELGPDVLSPSFNKAIFISRISAEKNRIIGNVLIDQKVISGIGNYLRTEILFHCRISPLVKVSSLGEDKLGRLYESTYNRTKLAYIMGGAIDYSDLWGKKGKYRPVIYGTKKYYDHEVKSIKLGSQNVYYIPDLQS